MVEQTQTLEMQARQIAARPYPTRLTGNPEDGYLVEVPDLPGCMTAAMNPVDALAQVQEAIEAWVADAIESSEHVPDPSELGEFSPIALRLPPDAFVRLSDRAGRLGMSPHQLASAMLSNWLNSSVSAVGAIVDRNEAERDVAEEIVTVRAEERARSGTAPPR